jgi:toxin secretion/phage lysis holin
MNEKILDHWQLKLIVAYIFTGISWAFDGKVEILYVVYSLIAIDTFTGVWAVIRLDGIKGISSKAFFRSPKKFLVYLIMMYVSRMVDRGLPVHIASPIMDAFLVTTEGVSILENFAKLGYPVPVFLISKLKALYEKKSATQRRDL